MHFRPLAGILHSADKDWLQRRPYLIREQMFQPANENGNAALAVHYAEGPDNGPPLVLLHGLTWRWQVFLPLLPALTETWHVFVPDLRGHGRSGRMANGYRGQDYCADLVPFLRNCVPQPAVIFGHSLGGMIALHIAATSPELVRALVLADNPLSIESLKRSHYPSLFAGLLQLLEQAPTYDQLVHCVGEIRVQVAGESVDGRHMTMRMADIPGNDAAFMRFWARSLCELDPDAVRMSLDGRAAEGWDGFNLLQQVDCATLLMQADPRMGGLMSEADVARARACIRGASHVRISNVGHPLYIQDAAPVLRALTNFLGSL